MASRLRTWVRRVTTPQTRALARSVAARVLDGVADAGERLGGLANTIRPALAPGPDDDAAIEIRPSVPPKPPPPAPAVDPRELGWLLARHVREQLDPLVAALLDTPLDLRAREHDAETLRVMRVSSRRLRSAGQVFGPWLAPKRRRRLEKDLRVVTRALGPVRDFDGVVDRFAAVAAARDIDPMRSAAAQQVLTRLAPPHAAARKRARKAMAGVDRDRLRADLREARRSIVERLTDGTDDVRPALLALMRPQIEETFDQTPVPTTLDDLEAVHDVRIIAKRLRYAHEWIKPALLDGPGPKRLLKRTQRVVGDARDLALFEDVLRTHAAGLYDDGLSLLADALQAWAAEIAKRRAKAEAKILPVLGDLSPRAVERLTAIALGQPS